jgi:hypothetical protein
VHVYLFVAVPQTFENPNCSFLLAHTARHGPTMLYDPAGHEMHTAEEEAPAGRMPAHERKDVYSADVFIDMLVAPTCDLI